MDFDLNVSLDFAGLDELSEGIAPIEDVVGSENEDSQTPSNNRSGNPVGSGNECDEQVSQANFGFDQVKKEFDLSDPEAMEFMVNLRGDTAGGEGDGSGDPSQSEQTEAREKDDVPDMDAEDAERSPGATRRGTRSNNFSGDEEMCAQRCIEIEEKLSVGSTVNDLEQAFLLYCEYGRCKGFSVRRGGQRYVSKIHEIRWKELKCSCNGLQDQKSFIPAYEKQITRTDCRAKIRVSRAFVGPWRVIYFEKNHNHELVPPDQSYLLRSSRKLSMAKKSVLEAMHAAGIGVSRACNFMEVECSGLENVGFIRRDAYAHIASKKKSKLENVDATTLVEYLTKKANAEPFFYWDVEPDDDGRIMNIFFRDSRCVVDYDCFGDVLSVDTTFKTNKYDLVCAPFVGINHHTNNVMLGMGFLSDEMASSFSWLFKTFLKSMSSREPQVIFTDQSQAMMKAIDVVFVKAAHRLCQWHVNQNAPSHFGDLNGDAAFKRTWHELMNHVESEAEWEELWSKTITKHKLGEHRWFRAMYKFRKRWASVFTHELFTGGILATSRSECTNKVLKDMCRHSGSLSEFVLHYERIQKTWRTKEHAEDAQCLWMPGQFSLSNRLLAHAASIYTRNVYKSFEFELGNSFNVILDEAPVKNGEDELIFRTLAEADGSHARTMWFDKHTHKVRCSCRMWEREGIFCRHIIKVYYVKNVMCIPDDMILPRWTKKAKLRTFVHPERNIESTGKIIVPYLMFLNTMLRHVHEMCSSAIEDNSAQKFIIDRIDALRKELFDIVGAPLQKEGDVPQGNNKKCVYRDPAVRRYKCEPSRKFVRHWKGPKKRGGKRPNNKGKSADGVQQQTQTPKKRRRSRFVVEPSPPLSSNSNFDELNKLSTPDNGVDITLHM